MQADTDTQTHAVSVSTSFRRYSATLNLSMLHGAESFFRS